MPATKKDAMRDLIVAGGPWDHDQRQAILDYCQQDVDALGRLLPLMRARIDLPRALLRGRYMAAVARMEWTGVPIDVSLWSVLRERWDDIKEALVAEIDRDLRRLRRGDVQA